MADNGRRLLLITNQDQVPASCDKVGTHSQLGNDITLLVLLTPTRRLMSEWRAFPFDWVENNHVRGESPIQLRRCVLCAPKPVLWDSPFVRHADKLSPILVSASSITDDSDIWRYLQALHHIVPVENSDNMGFGPNSKDQ